jgi:catechol 2,3-dioxygenase-like lactoylglutathione lyase family enzyme
METTMIDHVSTYATDYEATKRFYQASLATLGSSLQSEFVASQDPEFPTRRICGFGPSRPVFWVIEVREPASPRHIAFVAENRRAVARFHEAGLAAGGRDHGGPGLREIYHPHYFGAFVLDPDGNNVEAVCHAPEG